MGSLFVLPLIAAGVVLAILLLIWLSVRYIPNNRIGIVEKLWSNKGSLTEGSIIALQEEAGYQADILRGGLHFGVWRWQYAVHKFPLITVKQGKIGYVFARWRASVALSNAGKDRRMQQLSRCP